MKRLLFIITLLLSVSYTFAQFNDNGSYNQIDESGNITKRGGRNKIDSLGSDKEIPKGIQVWTIDKRFGDRTSAVLDTIPHMFMNSIFTTGMMGEFNTTGNLGAPRINRIFIDRNYSGQFIFTQPFDFFITPEDKFLFTNTLSPFTNITYNNAGDRINGEDHFTAKFGVNAGKRLGVGFKFDYLYGRGYYQNQSSSDFNYTMYGSYIDDKYQAHLLVSTNHQKMAENGGITDDNYIKHPESFSDNYETNEIPTVLEKNWNRNDNQHILFTQRYNIGFSRKTKMTDDEIKAKKFAIESKKENAATKDKDTKPNNKAKEEEPKAFAGRPDDAKIAGAEPDRKDNKAQRLSINKETADSILAAEKNAKKDTAWLKDEFVPVTSFIHTLDFNNYTRIYQAYETPENFYANTYKVDEKLPGDSIYDKTSHYSLKNTFAISLLEGFNKWAKSGIKGFITSDLRHFTLPDSIGTKSYNEHNLSIGGMINKTQGKTFHYSVIGETWLTGSDAGQVKFDATADLNFKLFGDTVTLAASGFLYRLNPTFYYRHYHSMHYWWDNDDMDKIIHSHIQGVFSYKKTRTSLRVAVDEIKNYTYFASSYTIDKDLNRLGNTITVNQNSGAINLITASLSQDFTLGPLNWENVITYQKSSNKDVLPVPDLNIYSNLYLRFKIAHVLKCDLGSDVRYFTEYYAPEYIPGIGQYTVQTNTSTNSGTDSRVSIGNYPIVNVYANFHLKHTRFFIMMSHVNAGNGNKNYFLSPHYPLNARILRIGLSWNFFN